MARIAVGDLYVVVFPHIDGYSHDTGTPEEVFPTCEEAQTYADECNEHLAKEKYVFTALRAGKQYYVESLYDRLQTIKDECRREGEHNARGFA
jgi:hypothetical protein